MFNGVFSLINTLFSFVTTLPVSNNSNNSGYNGLLIVLGIKPNVYSLDDYNSDIYSLSI